MWWWRSDESGRPGRAPLLGRVPPCSAESPPALGCAQPFLLEATLTECDFKCAERNHHLESETSLM